MVDEEPDQRAVDDLGEKDLDLGLDFGELVLDVGLDRAAHRLFLLPHLYMKKAGQRPLSAPRPGGGANESFAVLIAPEALSGGPCAVPVEAVVAAVGGAARGPSGRPAGVPWAGPVEQRAAGGEEGGG